MKGDPPLIRFYRIFATFLILVIMVMVPTAASLHNPYLFFITLLVLLPVGYMTAVVHEYDNEWLRRKYGR